MTGEYDVLYDLISIGTKVATGLATAQSLLSYHDTGAYGFIASIKMFWHFRFIAVLFNPNYWTVFYRQKSDFTSIQFSKSFLEKLTGLIPQYELPLNFEAYSYPSSFLVNFWDTLMTICLVLFLTVVAWIFECIFKRGPTLGPIFFKIRKALQWNFLISLFLTYINCIVLFTSFEWRNVHLQGARPIISFILSIIFALVGLAIPVISVRISLQAVKPENQMLEGKSTCASEEFRAKYPSCEVFYYVIRGLNISKHIFIPVYMARLILYYIAIAYLFEHTVAQCSVITGLNLLMLLYYIIINPFRTRKMQIFYIAQEVVLFVANVCMIILAIKADQLDSYASNVTKTLSTIITYAYLVFIYLGLIYLFIQVLFSLADLYKSLKTSGYKQVMPRNENIQLNQADVSQNSSSLHGLKNNDNNNSFINQYPTTGPFVPVPRQQFQDYETPTTTTSKPVYNLENVKNQEYDYTNTSTVPPQHAVQKQHEEPVTKPPPRHGGVIHIDTRPNPAQSPKKHLSSGKSIHNQSSYFQSDPQERTGTESVELPNHSNLVHLSYGEEQNSREVIRNGHVSKSQHLNANLEAQNVSYSETPAKRFSVPRHIARTGPNKGGHRPQN